MNASEPRGTLERAVRPLAFALLALAALRFVELGRWSLWIDEGFTLHDASALSGGVATKFPLALYATSAALSVFGHDSEFALRIAPAFFGALSLLLCAWAFRPAVGRARSLTVACIVGLSSWHQFWSQSARGYTLALALSVLGGGLVLRACLTRSTWTFFQGLALAALAAMAHPTAAIALPGLLAAPWIASRAGAPWGWRPSSKVLAFAAVALLLASPWAWAVARDYYARKSGFNTAHLALTCGYDFTPIVLLCALAGAWLVGRRGGAIESFALCVFLPGVIAMFAASALVIVSAQYLFVLLPWVALVASAPLFDATLHRRVREVLILALVGYGVFDLTSYYTLRHGDRPRWKEAYAYVCTERHDDDIVFGMAWPAGEFYMHPGSTSLRVPTALVRLTGYLSAAPAQWARRGRRMWFVVNREDLFGWKPDERANLLELLDSQCKLVRTFPVPGTPRDLDVEVYLRD